VFTALLAIGLIFTPGIHTGGLLGRTRVRRSGSTGGRVVTRWERYVDNYLGMVQLACARILLRASIR